MACWEAHSQREYTVDPGAPYHIVALGDLTEEERKTMRPFAKPMMIRANGEIKATDEAQIYVHNLEVDITPLDVLNAAPALLLAAWQPTSKSYFNGWKLARHY